MIPIRWTAAVLSGLTCVGVLTTPLRGAISVTASTDKPQYRRGEALHVSVTAHNDAAAPITLDFGSTIQSVYFMDGSYFFPQAGATVLTFRSIPANSSYTWTYRHNWYGYDLGLGSHDFFGRVVSWNPAARPDHDSPPGQFQVIGNVPMPSAQTINFDTLPDGVTAVRGAEEYWPYGVRFGEQSSNAYYRPGISKIGDNQVLRVNATTYPPGFNIIADFDEPITFASVDVSAAAGVSITMVAKDVAGEVVGSVASAPVPELNAFLPLSLQSNSPIYSLEWWPSLINSTVIIDNLSVHTPEPGGVAAVLLAGVSCCCRRSRSGRTDAAQDKGAHPATA